MSTASNLPVLMIDERGAMSTTEKLILTGVTAVAAIAIGAFVFTQLNKAAVNTGKTVVDSSTGAGGYAAPTAAAGVPTP